MLARCPHEAGTTLRITVSDLVLAANPTLLLDEEENFVTFAGILHT
jgi:hypothetical protein